MPFLSCHMQKVKRTGIVGLSNHIKRDKVSKTNPDIDYQKSGKNYDLIEDKNYLKAIDGIVASASNKKIKSDAVVLSAFVIGCGSKEDVLAKEKQNDFFSDCVDWFGNRYGKEKIVYATVHEDEKGASHLHLGLVPITNDGRLCCKDLFNQKELQTIQDKLFKDVGEKYGLTRGIKDSQKHHLSELEYKTKQENEKLEKIKNQINSLEGVRDIKLLDKAALSYVKKLDPKAYECALRDATRTVFLMEDETYKKNFNKSIVGHLIFNDICKGNKDQYYSYMNTAKIWADMEKDRRKKEKEREEDELERTRD